MNPDPVPAGRPAAECAAPITRKRIAVGTPIPDSLSFRLTCLQLTDAKLWDLCALDMKFRISPIMSCPVAHALFSITSY